jgi:hypothetical protein
MVFTLRPEAIAILTAELRDRRVVSFPADQAARLEVRWPERVFAFARRARPSAADPSAWAPEPGSGPPGFEAARVDPLIAALANLRALRFAQDDGPLPPGSGLAPPVASFRVQLKGDLGTRALRLGQPAGPGQRWATTAAGPSGAVFVLPESGWEPYLPPTGPAPAVLPEDVFAPDAKSPR